MYTVNQPFSALSFASNHDTDSLYLAPLKLRPYGAIQICLLFNIIIAQLWLLIVLPVFHS